MGRIWQEMGFIHYPLAFAFLAVIGLALWSTMRLYRTGATADLRTKAWIDAVLFWGGFAFVAGVLGTVVGVIVAAQSIERASAINPGLIWGGMKVALTSSAAGALILGLAGLVWFALQLRWRLMLAGEEEREA
jgi:MotA/TolQ/ExbB proton channel family